MKTETAANRLEQRIKPLLERRYDTVNVLLKQAGSFQLRYRNRGEDPFTIDGHLRGTVMPGPALQILSERSYVGYRCNQPLPARGRVGAYQMTYQRIID